MTNFQVAVLADMDQLPGLHDHQTKTPLIIFLWGFVKDVVSNTKVANLQGLHSRITAACALVDANMLIQTWQELMYRLDVLRDKRSLH